MWSQKEEETEQEAAELRGGRQNRKVCLMKTLSPFSFQLSSELDVDESSVTSAVLSHTSLLISSVFCVFCFSAGGILWSIRNPADQPSTSQTTTSRTRWEWTHQDTTWRENSVQPFLSVPIMRLSFLYFPTSGFLKRSQFYLCHLKSQQKLY